MKTYIITILVCLLSALGFGQSITEIEYYYNTDPGFGNANAISANTNSGELTQTFTIPTPTDETGFNTLYIRTKDDNGVWSLYDKRVFFITPDQNPASPIVAAEYFYDTDPGFGNGTPVTLVPTGNPDEFTVDLSTVNLTCGFYDFYIRVINADGTWSLYDYRLDLEVIDVSGPTIEVFDDISVQLDAAGQGSLSISDVDDGTFDDCQLVSVELDQEPLNFTCADLGDNIVTVTATDAAGNVSTLDVTVPVIDPIDPVADAQDITVSLDANGSASITGDDLDNNSTDNCSITNKIVDISTFDCNDIGANTVLLTVEDAAGNSDSISADVNVVDDLSPTALGQDITVDLAGNSSVSITADDVDDGSFDNCSNVTLSIDVDTFTAIGDFPVQLSVTDQQGNSSSVSVTVTVEDSLGINDPEASKINIDLYPNPTQSQLNIKTDANLNSFRIMDINGKVIISESYSENPIHVAQLSQGVYFIQLNAEQGRSVIKRFIKK